MRALALSVVLLLAGCATTSPQTVVKPDVREVTKLVTQRCIDVKDIPPKPQTEMRPDGDVQQKAAGAILDLHALDLYVERLLLLLHNCAS